MRTQHTSNPILNRERSTEEPTEDLLVRQGARPGEAVKPKNSPPSFTTLRRTKRGTLETHEALEHTLITERADNRTCPEATGYRPGSKLPCASAAAVAAAAAARRLGDLDASRST